MAFWISGSLILFLGLVMYARGWIYTLRPDGAVATKRKKKNLKKGWPTDMLAFGRKIRRVGFMVSLVGGALLAWKIAAL